MRKHIGQALRILTKVFTDGTYSNMAFYGENVSDMATRLVYGVLEENVKIDYILAQLLEKKPKNSIYYLLKIGVYAICNLTDVPKFAIVSECVEVCKAIGKGGASGFVNAVLKKVADGKYSLPSENDENYLSVTYSKPQWFIDKMVAQYGKDVTLSTLQEPVRDSEHIRVNSRLATCQDVEFLLKKSKTPYEKSEVGGYIVRATDTVGRMFDKGLVTYQSPSSMLAVIALGANDGETLLDLCSAPGGKAVYMSELCPHSHITACDIHEHRVALIQKYKNRMHVPNVKAIKADGTVFDEYMCERFDGVLVDAPCSCFGTYKKHPDVFLTRTDESEEDISKTQFAIISNVAKYVKKGGEMVYSTCTLFKEENEDIVHKFLESEIGKEFSLEKICGLKDVDGGKYVDNDGMIQILPHAEYDGFFIAKFRRAK